jgi:hypothetical protein
MIIQMNATVCGFWIMVTMDDARSLAATNEEVCRDSRKGPVARSNKKFRKRDSNAGSPADGGATTLGYRYFRAAEDGCRYGRPWPSADQAICRCPWSSGGCAAKSGWRTFSARVRPGLRAVCSTACWS